MPFHRFNRVVGLTWLSRRPVIWQMVIALVFIAAISAAIGAMEFLRERRRLEEILLLTTSAMEHSVAQEISAAVKFTLALSATLDGDLLNRQFSAAHEKSARALASTQLAHHVVLTEESGQQVFNTLVEYGRPLPVTKNLDRIKKVFESGKPRVSKLIIGTVSGANEIVLDVPIMRNGKVIYVLTSVMDSNALRNILLNQRLPDEWVANIFDGNGVIVARTRDHDKFVGKKVRQSAYHGDAWVCQY